MSENFENNTVVEAETTETTNVQPSHGMAVASLVLGILGVVFCTLICCFYYVGIALSVIGLVLAVMAKKNGNDEGICKAGLILSIIGVVFGVLWIILAIVGNQFSSDAVQQFKQWAEKQN